MSAGDHLGPQFTMRTLGKPYEIQHSKVDNHGETLDRYSAVGPPQSHPDYEPEDVYRPHYGSLHVRREGDKPVIRNIEIDDDHQSEGIGTALYHHAQAHLGETVYHDNTMTREGQSWAKKVGGPRFGTPETWSRIQL